MKIRSTRGAGSRDMTKSLRLMTEDAAERLLAAQRFEPYGGSFETPVCPNCGAIGTHYRLPGSRRWRCMHAQCRHTFSVFSGTRLDSAKLSPKCILSFLSIYEASPKGLSLTGVSTRIGITEKCAFQNLMKVREAIKDCMERDPLRGLVHIDGAWVCGRLRKSNVRMRKVTPADVYRLHGDVEVKRRLRTINPNSRANAGRLAKRRVMMALVEVGPDGGSQRVIVAMTHGETAESAMELAKKYVAPGTVIFTDENPAYIGLGARFEHHAVNHAECFSNPDGVNDNMAESFFSRMRRAQYGVHHGFRPDYMEFYAWEFAWRETRRSRPQSENVLELARWLLQPGYSEYWRGYHGGNKRRHTRRARPEIVMGLPRTRPLRDARSVGRKGPNEAA